jgi:hypothetical protein
MLLGTGKTRHNEVAPNQFELAPIFEDKFGWSQLFVDGCDAKVANVMIWKFISWKPKE